MTFLTLFFQTSDSANKLNPKIIYANRNGNYVQIDRESDVKLVSGCGPKKKEGEFDPKKIRKRPHPSSPGAVHNAHQQHDFSEVDHSE
jgi:hypothetical protein